MRLSRLGMARSFQLVNIFPQLSVRETLAVAAMSKLGMGGRLYIGLRRNRAIWKIVESVADLFGFSNKLDQTAKTLSQGDKKLLDVASAFGLEPEIILLDEPTSGVSTAEKSKIMQVLVHAAKQTNIKAIIQVEHDMDIVFGYSSRIIAVHNGRILADGSPTSIRAQTDVVATVVGRL
jgi:branched-chain amino acid transport system ATP-binding protein